MSYMMTTRTTFSPTSFNPRSWIEACHSGSWVRLRVGVRPTGVPFT